jgi:hypothetical protein
MRLFEFEVTWAKAVFDAVLPEHAGLPHGIAPMKPEHFFARTVAQSSIEQAIGMRLALWIVALAPIWFLRRPTTISSLVPTERQRILDRLLLSPIYVVRQLCLMLKAVASMLYAQSPEARRVMSNPRKVAATTALLDFEGEATDDNEPSIPPPQESGFLTLRSRRGRRAGGSRAA